MPTTGHGAAQQLADALSLGFVRFREAQQGDPVGQLPGGEGGAVVSVGEDQGRAAQLREIDVADIGAGAVPVGHREALLQGLQAGVLPGLGLAGGQLRLLPGLATALLQGAQPGRCQLGRLADRLLHEIRHQATSSSHA